MARLRSRSVRTVTLPRGLVKDAPQEGVLADREWGHHRIGAERSFGDHRHPAGRRRLLDQRRSGAEVNTPQSLLEHEAPQRERVEPSDDPTNEDDIFRLAWPLLEAFLRERRTAKEVAERFTLELAQARRLLKRAVEERLAERSGGRYRSANGRPPALWEDVE